MLNFTRLFGFLLAAMAAVLMAAPAQAQASRTWVSGNGSDLNPCSYTAPCKTFAAAYTATAAGGEIDALSPGGYGTLTIAKSLTIDGGGGQVASVLVSGTNGITVNGSGVIVTLKNLSINGLNASSTGISFSNGSRLNVVHCDIMGFTSYGIGFFPTVAGSMMFVSDTTVHGGNAYGIAIAPITSGAPSLVTLDGVSVIQNGVGLLAMDNSRTTITRSEISNNASLGAEVVAASGTAIVEMEESTVANNGGDGLLTSGGGTPRMRIAGLRISGNTGNSITGASLVFSFGNNHIVDNGVDIAPGNMLMPQ